MKDHLTQLRNSAKDPVFAIDFDNIAFDEIDMTQPDYSVLEARVLASLADKTGIHTLMGIDLATLPDNTSTVTYKDGEIISIEYHEPPNHKP